MKETQISTSVFPRLASSRLLLGRDETVLRLAPMKSKILLPTDFTKPTTRREIIDRYIKEWLTDRQQSSMSVWFRDLLMAFSTDLLLHAQHTGVEKLLMEGFPEAFSHAVMEGKTALRRKEKNYPLMVIRPQPEKPAKIEIGEVMGDLEFDAKVVPTVEARNTNEQ